MVYLINTDVDYGLMEITVDDIVKSQLSDINEFNLIKFDGKYNSLDEIAQECLNVSLFENKKVVIVYDSYFLSSEKTVGVDADDNHDKLLEYLKNQSDEVTLIFLVNNSKINKKSDIYKIINETGKIIYLPPLKENEWKKVVNDICILEKISIDEDGFTELVKRTLNDRIRLFNEIKKLKLYGGKITINEINLLVNEPLEDKIYVLSNLLLEGNSIKALLTYKDLLINNNDPNILIGMLSNQFRYYYVINYLKNNKKNNKEIADITKSKEIRVKICLLSSKNIKNKISSILEEIYHLDLSIKSGLVNPIKGLELFIINFNNKYLN